MGQRARIVGTGSALPERIVSNEELAGLTGISSAAIWRRTGIRERRWAAPDDATSDLAARAATAALAQAGIAPSALDAIIVSTTSGDTLFPATACHVQRLLDAKRAFAFDLSASCSGFLYALSVGDQLIQAGSARRILVVAAEIKSRFLNFSEGETAILFGDGAGAAALVPESEGRGIVSVSLGTDGSQANLIQIPAGGSRVPASEKTVGQRQHAITMRGPRLFRAAVRRLESAVNAALTENELTVPGVSWFLFHQANGRLLEKVRERLGVTSERTESVIERYGNTSSSSLPITLDTAIRAGKIKPHDLVLMATIGGGLTWGTALMRW